MRFENRTFENEEIILDAKQFYGCTFRNCKFLYGATEPVTLENCTFKNVDWAFIDSAALTINLMTGIYQSSGRSGKKLIEATFKNIRRGMFTYRVNPRDLKKS